MKGSIANLLLVLGTVFGGIAAANSARPWRWVDLVPGSELVGQVLYRDVDVTPDGADFEVRLAPAGGDLTEETIELLRGSGVERVRIKNPAREKEALSTGEPERLLGHILATPISWRREETIPAESPIEAKLIDRLLEAEVVLLAVRNERTGERYDVALDPDRAVELRAPMGDLVVAEDVALSKEGSIDADRYIDGQVLESIRESGVASVEVRNLRRWSWADWEWKWGFLGSVLAMLAGVLLKRADRPVVSAEAAADVAEEAAIRHPAQLRRLLASLEGELRRIDQGSAAMGYEELRREIDPLLTRTFPRFVGGREVLIAAAGMVAYAEVMGPFSAAERKLARAWSASVDGYPDEARRSLAEALESLGDAGRAFPSTTG